MSTTYDWSPFFDAINNVTNQWGQRNQMSGMINSLSGTPGTAATPQTNLGSQQLASPMGGQTTLDASLPALPATAAAPGPLSGMNPQVLQMMRNAPPNVSLPLLLQLATKEHKYSQTPQYDQSGKAFVLDDQGNMKPLDGVMARDKNEFINGQAVNPYNTPAGTVIPKQNDPNKAFHEDGTANTAYQAYQAQLEKMKLGPQWARVGIEAQNAGNKGLGNPITVEASDPAHPGQRAQFLAQQDKASGQWVTGDQTRTPLTDVMLPGGVPGGGRAAAQVGRMIGAAKDVVTGLQNVSELPISASTGLMGLIGGKQEAHSLWDASKTVLANQMTPQEVQSTKALYVGIAKAIGTLDAGGLQTSDTFLKQIGGLIPAEGDTHMTKLLKLAELRQQADNALEAQLNGPLLSSQQKVYAKELRASLAKSIPWTPLDVLHLDKSKDPNATIQTYAKGAGLAAPSAKAPEGVDPKVWAHMTPEEQALWH